MIRNYSPDDHVKCELISRNMNKEDYTQDTKVFDATIIKDIERVKYEIVTGTNANKTSFQIKAENCPYEIKQNDKIRVLGMTKLVSAVGIILSELDLLVNSKYNAEYLIKIAPKIIFLGD